MKIKLLRTALIIMGIFGLLFSWAWAASSDFIEIPSGVTVIQAESFRGASNLTEAVLHDNVTRIESRAFAGTGLNYINLPDSVSYIAPDAFEGCDTLKVLCSEGSYAREFCLQAGIPFAEKPLVIHVLQSEREKTLTDTEAAMKTEADQVFADFEGRLRLHFYTAADADAQNRLVNNAVRDQADMVLLNLTDAASADAYAKNLAEARIPVLYFNQEPAATAVSGQDAIFVGSKNGARANPETLAQACLKIAFTRLHTGQWLTGSGYTSQNGWSVLLDPAYRLAGIKIGIDPGHQRKANSAKEPIAPGSSKKKAKVSSGTYGKYTKTSEYVRVLQISFRLRDTLEKMGAEVYMTRETHDVNISNIERAQMMNNLKVDLVLRIHCDGASASSANGISIYAKKSGTGATASQLAAKAILPRMIQATGAYKRGVKTSNEYTGLNWSVVPSVLVECGFMTNEKEDKLLATAAYQQKLANGMAIGICDYFKR